MTDTQSQEQQTGGLFADPQALTPEQHAALRLKRIDTGFGFARAQHIVPVTAHEIPHLATHYPIIFVGPQNAPCAVMGIGDPVNLFVSPDGRFAEDADPPAALRQYPFFLKADADGKQMLLCIDRAAPHFSETEGEPLFADGKASKVCENVLQYLGSLDQQRRMTAKFVDHVKKLDLLTTQEIKSREPSADGPEPRVIATYVGIDEKKLAEVSDADRGELAKFGFLPVCYAMLMSQYNWRKLVRLAQLRAAASKAN